MSTASSLNVVIAIWQAVDAFHQALTTPANYRIAATQRDEDVVPLLDGAHVLIAGRFSPAMAAASSDLVLIQTPGAGTNAIDFPTVPARTAVCNVYGHERGIAEYVFTTMAMLTRDYIGMNQRIRTGDWADYLGPPLPELQGKTLAIVGLGRIGSEVARWGQFLGMRVVAATRTPDPAKARDLGIESIVPIDALHGILPSADYVVVCAPLTPDSAGLIGEREFTQMKPAAFLINVGRGELVAEHDLFVALRDRTIAGAAIDVWYRYPDGAQTVLPSELPFHELPNVIMTPHIAGATDATFGYRWRFINDNIHRVRDGEPLQNVVKPAAEEGSL
ncbi:MAG: hypothetical protein KF883_10155 [Thermomicrobiales bacterium]|nr:hypothetical protein [Thermomicrobiales bacterium]